MTSVSTSKPSNNLNRQTNLHTCFTTNYKGSLHILVASSEMNTNISNLHPVKLGKLFFNRFLDIQNIKVIGSSRVKVHPAASTCQHLYHLF